MNFFPIKDGKNLAVWKSLKFTSLVETSRQAVCLKHV